VRIGFFGAGVGGMVSRDAGRVAAHAEALGYASMWTAEHMVVPRVRPPYMKLQGDEWAFGDPLVMLAFLAASTSRIRLCTGVLLLPQRHPVHLAKELATLDVISGGRVEAGIGVGHLEAEMQALGVDRAERGARTDEAIRVMRALWAGEHSFQGWHYAYDDVVALPRPTRAQGVPIVVGGTSDAALRRAARFGNGWYGWGQDPDQVSDIRSRIGRLADEHGRRLDDFRVYVSPLQRVTSTLAQHYAAAGVDEVVVITEAADLDGVRRRLDHTAAAVEL
jgi:probable F420-dependent oxidoreductase